MKPTAFDIDIITQEAYDRGAMDAIERCAQVAEKHPSPTVPYANVMGKQIAEAIRALKDKQP